MTTSHAPVPALPHAFDAALLPDAQRLRGIVRGIEKEGLRARQDGTLSLTPHPEGLGSALTHPNITTDYSESQLELITGTHHSIEACLAELTHVHQFVCRSMAELGDDVIWLASMPCGLPTDETIPLGRYGNSHAGRAKSIYRMGLGHRYGRRMQTISGVHYNWSLPGLTNEQYFGLIRNFRRHAFVLMYLFGASPVLCPCFVAGREHALIPLGSESTGGDALNCAHSPAALHLPHATSLRMGRLGYQSDAQASIRASYNDLDGYAASLHQALTQPWPAYARLGIRNPGGDYNQLGDSLLQIENEFYSTIRPKRTTHSGERPLHALRQRGVEYIEVRLMDIDPFAPVGIAAQTMRVLDIFLLHCLCSPSPADSPEEIANLQHNQYLSAERGREPGLMLRRGGASFELLPLTAWAAQVLDDCQPIAAALDAAHGTHDYSAALDSARALCDTPEQTPSARVLEQTRALDNSFSRFGLKQSRWAQAQLLALPWSDADQAHWTALSEQSRQRQHAIEAADTGSFEDWRLRYMNPADLGR